MDSILGKSERRELQTQTNCDIMFRIKDSIIGSILKEYFILLLLHYAFVIFFELQIIKNTHLITYVHNFSEMFKVFPTELVMIPLGFMTSAISSQRDEAFKSSVTFLDGFAYFLVTHIKDEKKRREILEYALLMVAATFEKMEENVVLGQLDLDKRCLSTLSAYRQRIGAEDVTYYTDHYFIAWQMLKLTDTPEEHEALYAKTEEVTERCRIMLQFKYRSIPFLNFSTLIICCNLYVIHIFIKSVSMTHKGHFMISILDLSIRFFILYGWPKQYINLYYPFGKSGGRFNLLHIEMHNIKISREIIEMGWVHIDTDSSESESIGQYPLKSGSLSCLSKEPSGMGDNTEFGGSYDYNTNVPNAKMGYSYK